MSPPGGLGCRSSRWQRMPARGACKSRDIARENVPGAWQVGTSISPYSVGCYYVETSTKHTADLRKCRRGSGDSPSLQAKKDQFRSISLCPVLLTLRFVLTRSGPNPSVWHITHVLFTRLRARSNDVPTSPPSPLPRIPQTVFTVSRFPHCDHGTRV